MSTSQQSLKQQIASANSEQEILNILNTGKEKYLTAIPRTRNQWKSVARKRILELSKPQKTESPVVEEDTISIELKNKKKKLSNNR